MTCTKEEIERKRLAALQKKQAKITNHNISSSYSVTSPKCFPKSSGPGPMKGNVNNTQTFHPYIKSPSRMQEAHNTVPITKVVSGTLYLISENRFEVNPSEFCTPLISVFRTIPSKSYDDKSNLWNFSFDDYDMLMEKVAPLAPHIVLGPLPPYVLKILKQKIADPSEIDLSPIERPLREKLLTFQKEGVRFGIARRGRCMIADEMGLGKTFQALAIASYYRHDWPLLVVTTSSMREVWQAKINELLPSIPVMNIVTLSTRKDALLVADRQTEVVIVSYKITTIHTDLLKRKKFGVVIIDESHNLKSVKAQCTVALRAVARAAARVVLLSGTPALSRPAELFTQLSLIEPRLFTSYIDYGKRYCAGKQSNYGWDMSGQSHLAELAALLHRRFLIRRTKEQVLCLDEKTREAVMLDESLLDFSQRDRAALSRLGEACARGGPAERRASLLAFFAESACVRIPAVCAYVREACAAEGGKLLVFAHHRAVLRAVRRALDEARVTHVAVHGDTPPAQRAALVERFQSEPGCRCAVLSITAAGAGLTLSAAALVLFAELPWTPAALAQAEARAHRLGRSGAVRVRYLLARGTADDALWPMLRDKLHVLNDVRLTEDSFEDVALKHQESKNSITKYLSPVRTPKNRNDYIPGTNIRKGTENTQKTGQNTRPLAETFTNLDKELEDIGQFFLDGDMVENGERSMVGEDIDKSFLADDEGDELLANIDL